MLARVRQNATSTEVTGGAFGRKAALAPTRDARKEQSAGARWDVHDWREQLRRAITGPALSSHLVLSPSERKGVLHAESKGLPVRVSPYYLSLCDPRDPRCPIRLQCVPQLEERMRVDGDLEDPLGEREHEVAPWLIQRYPDRALLLVSAACPMHCRFCTRSRVVAHQRGVVPLSALEPAWDWLARHRSIREVILSGGDPLVASTARISALLERVRSIPHIEVIRIATRVPSALPMRITSRLVASLRRFAPLWVMTHFNHPRELSDLARTALGELADGGIPMMNQTVLLRGVNDDPEVLASLFRGLVSSRVRPYYLLHADSVAGSAHLRTSVADSIRIFGALQGRLSGIALPKLMVDTPGGKGKVPIGPETIVQREGGRTVLRTFRDETVTVLDPGEGP